MVQMLLDKGVDANVKMETVAAFHEDHDKVLTSMNNSAAMLDKQGKHEEAEEMHGKILALKQRVIRTNEWQ